MVGNMLALLKDVGRNPSVSSSGSTSPGEPPREGWGLSRFQGKGRAESERSSELGTDERRSCLSALAGTP